MKKDTTNTGLYVSEKNDGEYYHCFATIVTIGATASDRQWQDADDVAKKDRDRVIRNASDELVNGLYLDNLTIWSQGENSGKYGPRKLYAWSVEYRSVFSVDQRKAERMGKTLKTIGARMAKLDQKYGRPSTFGAYIGRVAAAIGSTSIVSLVGKGRGWSYAENEHNIMTIVDGIYHVDRLVDTWIKAGTPEAIAV